MMRRALLSCVLCGAVLGVVGAFGVRDAAASLVWGEADEHGVARMHWARGASPEEAVNILRAHAGEKVNVLATCRQEGWFAFVGSTQDGRHGISCGYETKQAALAKARAECEVEGGSCEVERLGYDDGAPLLASGEGHDGVPLPGQPNDRSPVATDMGTLDLQEKWGRILDF